LQTATTASQRRSDLSRRLVQHLNLKDHVEAGISAIL
jgi:hypothetical protein